MKLITEYSGLLGKTVEKIYKEYDALLITFADGSCCKILSACNVDGGGWLFEYLPRLAGDLSIDDELTLGIITQEEADRREFLEMSEMDKNRKQERYERYLELKKEFDG